MSILQHGLLVYIPDGIWVEVEAGFCLLLVGGSAYDEDSVGIHACSSSIERDHYSWNFGASLPHQIKFRSIMRLLDISSLVERMVTDWWMDIPHLIYIYMIIFKVWILRLFYHV